MNPDARAKRPWWRTRFGLRAQLLVALVVVVCTLVLSLGGIALWSLQGSLQRDAEHLAESTAEIATTLLEGALHPSEPLAGPTNQRRLLSHLRRLHRREGLAEILIYRERGDHLRLGSSSTSAEPGNDPDLALALTGSRVPTRKGDLVRAYGSSRGPDGRTLAIRVTVSASRYVDARLGTTRRTLVWLALVDGLLVLLFGALFLMRRLLGPLGRLEQASAQVAAGDSSSRLPVEAEDELGRLATRFNDMLDRLADRDRRLKAQVDELQQKQKELDQSWEMLLGAAKLASVGRLTAGVAHELGNPMSSILGYLELLGDPDAAEKDRQKWLGRVREEIQRMDRTIRALLETARPGDGAVARTELMPLVRNATELMKHQPRLRDVDVRLDLEGLPPVAASGRLPQVFMNLLLNAGDALRSGGRGGVVRIHGKGRGEQVLLWVEDNGPGIPETLRRDLFDPFVTTKPPGEGTGLGLAICQSILEASGGRIGLANPQPQKGASFELRFRVWKESGEDDDAAGEGVR